MAIFPTGVAETSGAPRVVGVASFTGVIGVFGISSFLTDLSVVSNVIGGAEIIGVCSFFRDIANPETTSVEIIKPNARQIAINVKGTGERDDGNWRIG